MPLASFQNYEIVHRYQTAYWKKDARIRAHIFVCILSLRHSRIIDKKMTIAEIIEKLLELRSVPAKSEECIITLRSES